MKFVSRLVVAALLMAQADAALSPPLCPQCGHDPCGSGYPPQYQLCDPHNPLVKICIAFPRIVKLFAVQNYKCCSASLGLNIPAYHRTINWFIAIYYQRACPYQRRSRRFRRNQVSLDRRRWTTVGARINDFGAVALLATRACWRCIVEIKRQSHEGTSSIECTIHKRL